MRLRVLLDNPAGTRLPINYQEYLTAAVYDLLGSSDAEYAQFLHDDGYADEDGRRFKLFTFSWLRGGRRVVEGDRLHFAPGPVEWQVASPIEDFLRNLATGLLAQGHIRIGSASLPITQIETLSAAVFSTMERFTCLSPIVAALPLPDGGTRYLRPSEGAAFSQAVHNNLRRKYRLLNGDSPTDDTFILTFDPAYLERSGGGTKLITYKNIGIVGAFCPFTVSGSAELLRVGYETGFGEKNAAGFGMVEVKYVVQSK